MPGFKLQQGTDSFEFDTGGTGRVKKNGADFGVWATNAQNHVVATPAAGAPVKFVRKWQFNNKNELCLFDGATEVFNFHSAERPRYDLVDAVLKVKPSSAASHQFELRGDWDLAADLKLTFQTPDGTKSTIDGALNDLRSRFIYRFASLTPGREDHSAMLVFVGRWTKDTQDSTKLNFIFKLEKRGTEPQAEDTFILPGSFQFTPATNQLLYQFGGGKHRIAFVGTLRVSPSFQISYSVAQQVSTGNQTQIGASDIVVDAVFANASFSGDMQLAVQRPGGGAPTIFTVSGHFTHVRKSGTQIGVGFAISGGTGSTPTVVAFSGQFAIANNGSVGFTFARNSQTTTIGFSADQIRLGSTTISASATIVMDGGQVRSVEAMFGFTFPLQSIGAVNT